MDRFDIAVIGAGHAGMRGGAGLRAHGASRPCCLTLNLDSIALMPCNPAIGGTGKGHLVRELDALGGEMGRAIDDTFIQSRMLNTGKGPAVHSLRAQADKRAYQQRMKRALFAEPRLTSFVRAEMWPVSDRKRRDLRPRDDHRRIRRLPRGRRLLRRVYG